MPDVMGRAPDVASDSRPVWFSGVMATGIVALAVRDARLDVLSWVLAGLAGATWLVLVRLLLRPEAWTARSPEAALQRFAFVAATDVLASLAPGTAIPVCLLLLATAAWCALLPGAIRTQLGPAGHGARERASGSWLLVVVATESLAVTAAAVGRRLGADWILLLAALSWLVGLCLYAALVGVVVQPFARRIERRRFAGDDWILMGALAIAALAGSRVHAALTAERFEHWLLPLVRAGSLACWTVAVCWLTVLVAAEWGSRGELRYRVTRWSTVFPLGMLAAASHALAGVFGFDAGRWLFDVLVWVACAAWLVVSLGFVRAAERRTAERRS